MKSAIRIFIATVAFSVFLKTSAQNDWCATDRIMQEQMKSNPALKTQFEKNMQQLAEIIANNPQDAKAAQQVYLIPVVVHVIHDNGVGNISLSQIKDGIRVLNEDFLRLNADSGDTRQEFLPYAATSNFEFRLALKDPQGNPTDGVVRKNSPLTNNADDAVKGVSYWNSSKYFNIWLVNSIGSSGTGGTTLGYAQFPGWGSWNTYGLVMRHDQFGRVGTSNADGRTTTHEVGHCLSLFHTFQSGCGSTCQSSGDNVCDTPPVTTSTWSCSQTQNTCSNDTQGNSPFTQDMPDQIENYMSYDDCQNMFSEGQKSRMRNTITQYTQLTNLTSTNNHNSTGVNSLSLADFSSDINVFCAGQTVNYTDESAYNQTSWNWVLTGASPATSTQQNPSVVYNTPGLYDVSLTVSDGTTSKSKTKNGHILVVQNNTLPFSESFEGVTMPNTKWYIANNDNDLITWKMNNSVGYTGTSCLMIDNYNNSSAGFKDDAIVGSFDLSQFTNQAVVSFKVAYAQKSSTSNDKLRVYISLDCGKTWTIRFAKAGSSLASAPVQSVAFTPASAAEWKEHVITLSSSFLKNNVLFRFEFDSQEGNNIYLDDINIDNTIGIEKHLQHSAFNVFPNPLNEYSVAAFTLFRVEQATLEMFDVLGKSVAVIYSGNLSSGIQQFEIPSAKLSKGVYFVRLTTENGVINNKVIKE